jgi:eukaryotic-like serine/threonine-protein kinase
MSMSETSRVNRDRWQRVEQIYVAALDREREDRASLLSDACGHDAALRQDVESLLAVAPRATGFIERPALDDALALLADAARTDLVGRSIGPYTVEAWIGSGGMGDVYRARDRHLQRHVALKVLPDVFALDTDRLERFAREAQVLAALNHPNIAAIHGFERADGVQALALELVEGHTLADRLERGPIPLDEGLPIAGQIAEGLEAAHEQGIVHRDLKPSNVAIRPDGTVKILDFGLAEVLRLESAAPGDGAPSSVTLVDATPAAVTFGTPAYMSPEQAKGRPLDKRSDIWAFGILLFELLSGRRPFPDQDMSEVPAAMAQDADWSVLPTSTPATIRTLIARCLERNPRLRLRDIGEARIALQNASAPGLGDGTRGRGTASARGHRRRIAIGLITVAIAAVAAVAAVAAWRLTSPPRRDVTRFALTLPDGQVFSRGLGRHVLAISRDGAQVVYSGVPAALYRRALSQLEATRIEGTEGFARVSEPAFSPDGRSIAFYADGALRRIAVTGGAAVTLAAIDPPFGISWEADAILFGQGDKGILRVSPEGGTPQRVVRVEQGDEAHGPQMLPDGGHVLFTLAHGTATDRWNRARIVVQSLSSNARTTIVDGGSDARYLATGHLVYALSGVLYAAPFDTTRRALSGAPVPIVEGVSRATGNRTGAAHYGVSDTGTLIYIPGPIDAAAGLGETTQLGLIDRTGVIERLPLPPDTYQMPRVAPNGARIAFVTDDGKEAIVWVYDLIGNVPKRRLTFGGNNRFPVWSSDGTRIAFQSDRDGDAAIFAQTADGGGAATRLTRPLAGVSHVPESWSPNGQWLLFTVEKPGDVALWVLSTRDGKSAPFGDIHSTTPTAATFSPDGRWVAYGSTSGGRQTVLVQPFPATGAKYQLETKGLDTPSHPVWSRTGKELFYNPRPQGLEVVGVSTEPTLTFANSAPVPRPFQLSPPEQRRAYDVTRSGRFVARISPSNQTQRAAGQVIQIVVNWSEELHAKVPVSAW